MGVCMGACIDIIQWKIQHVYKRVRRLKYTFLKYTFGYSKIFYKHNISAQLTPFYLLHACVPHTV